MNAPLLTQPICADPFVDQVRSRVFFSDEARAARAARRLEVLADLAGIGLEMAGALRRRVLDEAAQGADQSADSGLSLAFARVSRAVRQTVALEDKLDHPPQAPVLTPEAERAAWLVDLQGSPGVERLRSAIHRNEVGSRVLEVVDADRPDAESLVAELNERLDAYEAEDDFLNRPVGEMIASICRDLGVTPDWSLWRDEDWALDEAERKPPGSPYADRRRRSSWAETMWLDDHPWARDEESPS